MFYEKKIINGVLMFRNSPTGAWRQFSIEAMSTRIIELEEAIANIRGGGNDE